jgi:hypothetical protein
VEFWSRLCGLQGANVAMPAIRGKVFTSPLAVHAKVRDGKIVYFMFMEDTFASARSFSGGATWRIKTDPKGREFQV